MDKESIHAKTTGELALWLAQFHPCTLIFADDRREGTLDLKADAYKDKDGVVQSVIVYAD